MATVEAKTEQELYEDWKPLLEGQQDTIQAESGVDVRLLQEKGWVEQTNSSVGVGADGKFPVEKRPHNPAVAALMDDCDDAHGDW